jgi:hypothetical protein
LASQLALKGVERLAWRLAEQLAEQASAYQPAARGHACLLSVSGSDSDCALSASSFDSDCTCASDC